jgi:hypothetical protein
MEHDVTAHITFEVVKRKKELTFKCTEGKIYRTGSNRPAIYTASFQFHPPDIFDGVATPPFQFLLVKRGVKTLHVCLFISQQHNSFGTYHLYGNHPYLTVEEVRVFKKITGSDEETIRDIHPETFPDPEKLLNSDTTTLLPSLFQVGDEVSLYW